jgi:poly-gamma-glutamate capsule biosynthesis protein CapA/YwtB (metallophosphatase superfamily)
LVAAALTLWACAPREEAGEAEPLPDPLELELRVVDDQSRPLPGARVALNQREVSADREGIVRLRLNGGPELAVVRADGYFAEPVPVGWHHASGRMDVRLFPEAEGRAVLHFGGDSMMGRRYESPTSGEPLLTPGAFAESARAVVEPLRRAFSAADFRVLNLETVVSTLGDEFAYPGKRFLLRSHPETLAALEALETDLVIFANNHTRDWLDQGVADTLAALEEVGLPAVGAGMSAEEATRPVVLEAKGVRIGTLAYTSVNGSFVNDNYPPNSVPRPSFVPDKDAWLYEERAFSYAGDEWSLPAGQYRIGEVWRRFSEVEATLSPGAVAAAWAALTNTYPELQDWVARRGHGGAAAWQASSARTQIGELRPNVDLVVVQLHSGYQFQAAASVALASAARTAIDAGADLVIAHHPHVLQGIEWYKGKLIVYSLGNFIFDQDFLSTFPSGFLRVIWERDRLLEARFVPLALVGYRPMPVADRTARNVLRTVWERSVLPARSERVAGGVVPLVSEKDADTRPAQMRMEWNTARLVQEPRESHLPLVVEAGEVAALPSDALLDARLGLGADAGPGELLVGRDVYGWGHFDDDLVDGFQGGAAQWVLDYKDKRLMRGDGGERYLRLERTEKNKSRLLVRSVARIPLSSHRLYDYANGELSALDPTAVYDLRLRARVEGQARPSVRFDVYDFDDTNPTEDPSSVLLAQEEFPLVPESGAWESGVWQSISVPFDPEELTGSQHANMVMIYLVLDVPEEGQAALDVDDVALIEWRDAAGMPDLFGAFTHVKNLGAVRELSVPVLLSGG